MRDNHPGAVANYTNAFLVSFGVVVFMGLFVIWAIWGLIMAALPRALEAARGIG